MASSVQFTQPDDADIHSRGDVEAIERFRDIRDDLRQRMPFEVTNEFTLNVICDVYDLHREDEDQ